MIYDKKSKEVVQNKNIQWFLNLLDFIDLVEFKQGLILLTEFKTKLKVSDPVIIFGSEQFYINKSCSKAKLMKHLHDISCVFQGFQGVGAIYISGISIAKNVELLKKHNIKAVICAARSGYVQYDHNIISQYLYIAADDNEQFNLSQYFLKAYDFIDSNRKKTNVLVHCMAGISRSATIILAYLIKKYGYSVDMVLSLMKRKRPIIQPNQGFMIQLRDFSNIHNEKQQTSSKTPFRRINYQDNTHSCDSRKINSSNQKRQKKRQLSTFSKQFLLDLQKEKTQRKNIKSFRHLNKFQEQMKMNSEFLQRETKTEQLKSNFYSEELGQELNVIQVKSEIKQLSEQHLLNQTQVSVIPVQNNNQKQKTPISVSEKLDKIKQQLMKQYKRKSNKQLQNFQAQNQQQITFGALMANKIIRGGKSRRICQKEQKQKKNLFNLS